MKKAKYWLLGTVAITIIVLGLSSVISKVIVRYAGKKVVTVITEVPSECDRYNYIKVLLGNMEYEVSISRISCRDGVYKIGQRIELLKYKKYRNLEWPGTHPEVVLVIIVALLLFGYFTMKKRYRK